MTKEEIKITNKTARSTEAIGKNALLPRIIRDKWPADKIPNTFPSTFEILDFGAGPKAPHTDDFVRDGYWCTAYEIGDNFDENVHYDKEGLQGLKFDVVMVSNVINTLSSLSAIKETIKEIHYYTDKKGVALINLPISPRKYEELTKEKLMELLLEKFKSVMVENHNGTRVFYCYRYATG